MNKRKVMWSVALCKKADFRHGLGVLLHFNGNKNLNKLIANSHWLSSSNTRCGIVCNPSSQKSSFSNPYLSTKTATEGLAAVFAK